MIFHISLRVIYQINFTISAFRTWKSSDILNFSLRHYWYTRIPDKTLENVIRIYLLLLLIWLCHETVKLTSLKIHKIMVTNLDGKEIWECNNLSWLVLTSLLEWEDDTLCESRDGLGLAATWARIFGIWNAGDLILIRVLLKWKIHYLYNVN